MGASMDSVDTHIQNNIDMDILEFLVLLIKSDEENKSLSILERKNDAFI